MNAIDIVQQEELEKIEEKREEKLNFAAQNHGDICVAVWPMGASRTATIDDDLIDVVVMGDQVGKATDGVFGVWVDTVHQFQKKIEFVIEKNHCETIQNQKNCATMIVAEDALPCERGSKGKFRGNHAKRKVSLFHRCGQRCAFTTSF